MTTQKPY